MDDVIEFVGSCVCILVGLLICSIAGYLTYKFWVEVILA